MFALRTSNGEGDNAPPLRLLTGKRARKSLHEDVGLNRCSSCSRPLGSHIPPRGIYVWSCDQSPHVEYRYIATVHATIASRQEEFRSAMTQPTPLPGYEEEMKQEAKHVEYGAKVSHVDLHDAAAPGHLATDLYGHALVTIDKAASDRLARKVSGDRLHQESARDSFRPRLTGTSYQSWPCNTCKRLSIGKPLTRR